MKIFQNGFTNRNNCRRFKKCLKPKTIGSTVDIGTETRTIVSGIAEFYTPDTIIGQKVTVLCNLKPRALRGVESQGMLLMAKASDGQLVFVQPGIPIILPLVEWLWGDNAVNACLRPAPKST